MLCSTSDILSIECVYATVILLCTFLLFRKMGKIPSERKRNEKARRKRKKIKYKVKQSESVDTLCGVFGAGHNRAHYIIVRKDLIFLS